MISYRDFLENYNIRSRDERLAKRNHDYIRDAIESDPKNDPSHKRIFQAEKPDTSMEEKTDKRAPGNGRCGKHTPTKENKAGKK